MADNSLQNQYTALDIERYLNGSMSAAEMHDLERAALQDPFLSDAIEGFREADPQAVPRHLQEIESGIRSEKTAPSPVIQMPAKRQFGWQIAASLLVIAASVLLLVKINKDDLQTETQLAQSENLSSDSRDTLAQRAQENSNLQSNSHLPVTPAPQALQKEKSSVVKKSSSKKEKHIAKTAESLQNEIALNQTTMPGNGFVKDYQRVNEDTLSPDSSASAQTITAMTMKKNPASAFMSDSGPQSLGDIVASSMVRKKAAADSVKRSDVWTSNGKIFRLSEVETIHLGTKKAEADTANIRPEGGWSSFQEYLFSKLKPEDTLGLPTPYPFDEALELEFSLTQNGTPYNVQVIHAPDSFTAEKAVTAIEEGPKWIRKNKQKNRIRIQY